VHRLPVTFVDVFTDTPLTGNGLVVVHDADDLTPEMMQAFARETRLSETTFVQAPASSAADYRNRIWTVVEEIPFAGHPSLGTAAAVAWARGVKQSIFTQQTVAGLQQVTVELLTETQARASVLQEPPQFGPWENPGPLLDAVGLDPDDAHLILRPRLASTGLPAMLVPLATEEALARATPNWRRLAPLVDNGYFFWINEATGRVVARCFPPAQSEGEDPATGSAAGALMAYLHAQAGLTHIVIEQGAHMGRPGRIEASMRDGCPEVAGGVVLLMTGELRIPAQ
jgi:trans-2,3-dihydro-3-hydroxyanthranilate isomerase